MKNSTLISREHAQTAQPIAGRRGSEAQIDKTAVVLGEQGIAADGHDPGVGPLVVGAGSIQSWRTASGNDQGGRVTAWFCALFRGGLRSQFFGEGQPHEGQNESLPPPGSLRSSPVVAIHDLSPIVCEAITSPAQDTHRLPPCSNPGQLPEIG